MGPQLLALDVSTGNWTQLADMHQNRRWPACLVYQGNLWVIGGYTGTSEYYNPDTNVWTEGPTFPEVDISNILYGYAFEFNGSVHYLNNWTKKVYKLDLENQAWIKEQEYGGNTYPRRHWLAPPLVNPQLLGCKI